MSIGDNIKALRERYGLTQQQLGGIAGVSDKAVSTWESNVNVPRMGAIQKIADHFGIMKSEIIEDAVIHPTKVPVELSNVYFRFAKDAEKKGIDPRDIEEAIEMINRFRSGGGREQ